MNILNIHDKVDKFIMPQNKHVKGDDYEIKLQNKHNIWHFKLKLQNKHNTL